MPTRRRNPIYDPIILLAAFAVLLAVSSVTLLIVTHKPAHRLQMFDGGVPGTSEALDALQFAHDNGIDDVINYSFLNADLGPRATYMKQAYALGVTIIPSLKDLLGEADMDPVNAQYHNYYGYYAHPELKARHQTPSTTQIVDGVLKALDSSPVIGGYYISDERPEDPTGPEGLDKWVGAHGDGPLAVRYHQIKAVSDKPVLVSLYWVPDNGGSRTAFMKEVKKYADQLMVDYYPYPDGDGHKVWESEIPAIGRALKESAGTGGTYVFQAFSWDAEPDTAKAFGFAPGAPAPDAKAMVKMAKAALAGGAYNLALFSYEYMQHTPGQSRQVAQASAQIRAMEEFRGASS